MRIGTLDSETLSLQTNAVVYSIGLMVIECDEHYVVNGSSQFHRWTPPFLEQLAMGTRHVDPATVRWAISQYGMRELQAQMIGARSFVKDEIPCLMLDHNAGLSVKEVLTQLRDLAMPCDELWINKASFDSGILHSLAEQIGITGGLWKHKAELDLRPLYRKIPVTFEQPKLKHNVEDDCFDNLAVLQTFGQFLASCNGK